MSLKEDSVRHNNILKMKMHEKNLSDTKKSPTNKQTKLSGSKTKKNTKPIKSVKSAKNSEKKPNKSQQNSETDNLNPLEKLYNFMKKYRNESKRRTGKNIPWTHTMPYEPYGSYDIPDDIYKKTFLKLYEDAIVAGYRPHISENHKEFGPIVIDFDFVQSKEHNKRYYTQNTITNIIKLYNEVIKTYLDVSSNKMEAYVLEKKAPNLRRNEYHDGIHIVYPYICTKPCLQMLMRKDFLERAEKHKIFKKLPLVNDLDSVFDKGVIYKVGWMLYGSVKNPSCHPYYVTHIYSTANGKVFDTLIPGEDINKRSYIRHFIDVLSCRRYFNVESITPLADGIDPVEIDSKINNLKENLATGMETGDRIERYIGTDTNFIKAVSEELLAEAKNLVSLFSKKRATDWATWIQVGRCLHNIDYRLLNDWIEFSKKTTRANFKKGECENLWKKMKPYNYTMATLHYFASQDNPDKYVKMKEEKINKLIKNGLEASHNTIAKLLLEKYKFIYRCASIKHNVWYEFKNHRWVEIDSACSLYNLISDELTLEYSRYQSYLYDISRQKEGNKRERYIEKAGHISKVIKSLNNSTFKNGVIKECAYISYDPNFLKTLDENIYLICFNNGVYDLESDTFRGGCPDDYISLCTGYNYVEYDENDETSIEINKFLNKIQPDLTMREYLMTLLSTCLAGSICEESFYVFTGSGANGKSKLMELLKYAMGDLFKPMDVLVLVGKRTSSSGATPEIADKKGIRVCPFDEPRSTDEINTGFMKIFTGGDTIMARALFKEPIYFKPQFKPFLLCNHLPNIKSDDDGTWRRLKVIPFGSKFIKREEASRRQEKYGLPENHFWADKTLSEKLPDWKEMFMGMLINYYRKYKKGGLIHPKLVTQETAKYRKRCDIFQDFIGDYLEKTNSEKDSISVQNLHEAMRSWYRANYDGKCPTTKDLRSYLQQRISSYNPKNDSLMNYRIKTGDNDDMMDELGKIK